MLEGKNILIGVPSGIAIYKVLDLISKLKKKKSKVKVIMTPNATEFISPKLFEVMSKSNVYLDQFEDDISGKVNHISLAEEADLFLIAPATANTIAKIACGIADNLLTSTVLAYTRPLIFAPAMNTNMLNNPNTQRNIDTLKEQGHEFIDSNVGLLACDLVGDGRMAEPIEIIDYLEYQLTEKDLSGINIIVTAGPTREKLDPVRYISNKSSGKMGYSIARAARNRGANVTLISGPVSLDKIKGIKTIMIESTKEMYEEIGKYFPTSQVLIMAAAPSDFKVKNISKEKIKKNNMAPIEIEENIDIVAYYGSKKEDRIIIGFAAETQNLIENAREKIKRKNLDYILANDVSKDNIGFDVDNNEGYLISEEKTERIDFMSKFEMANIILDKVKNV